MEAHPPYRLPKGARPLWTPPAAPVRANLALGDTPRPLPKGGALWTPALSTRTCYAFPFAPPRHCECSEAVWGGGGALYFCFGESSLKSGSDHPPSPLPRRKGEEKKSSLWRHILHTACQRGRAPSGLPLDCTEEVRPPPDPCHGALWTPALRTLEVRRRLGDTPRPLPKGGALWTPAFSTRTC